MSSSKKQKWLPIKGKFICFPYVITFIGKKKKKNTSIVMRLIYDDFETEYKNWYTIVNMISYIYIYMQL